MRACPDCGDVVHSGVGARRLCPACYAHHGSIAQMNLGLAVYRPGAAMVLSYDGPISRPAPPALPARTDVIARLGFGGGMPRWMCAT